MAVIYYTKFNSTKAQIITRIDLSIFGTTYCATTQDKSRKKQTLQKSNIKTFVLVRHTCLLYDSIYF